MIIQIEEVAYENLGEFWQEHIKYLVGDGFVDGSEELEYFSGEEYRGVLAEHMLREKDKQHMVWFVRGGERIGAASFCTYQSEEGKCFILDFWVFPSYRGGGTGHGCFEALEKYTRADGALYYELNSTHTDSIRFWRSLGFRSIGRDEYGMELFAKGSPFSPAG